jgi:hypothetical protein
LPLFWKYFKLFYLCKNLGSRGSQWLVFQFSSIDFSLPYYSIHNAYYYVGWIRLGPDELEISDGGCLLHRLPQYCRGRKVGTSGIPYAVFADPLRFGPDPDPTCQNRRIWIRMGPRNRRNRTHTCSCVALSFVPPNQYIAFHKMYILNLIEN